jgi:IS5 family transposase
MSETSRVNREIYARFCEGLGVKFPRPTRQLQKKKNRSKSSVRAKVEHVFRILKRIFGFDKVRYRGIAKNHNRLCATFALVNLYLHRKRLLVQRA